MSATFALRCYLLADVMTGLLTVHHDIVSPMASPCHGDVTCLYALNSRLLTRLELL